MEQLFFKPNTEMDAENFIDMCISEDFEIETYTDSILVVEDYDSIETELKIICDSNGINGEFIWE